MRFALIDTRKQTADTVGAILIIADTIGDAAGALLARYPGKPKHRYEPAATIWQVGDGAAIGMSVPMAEADWCAPLTIPQHERLQFLLYGARTKVGEARALGWQRQCGAAMTKLALKRLARKGE